jgi:hypothetical protein
MLAASQWPTFASNTVQEEMRLTAVYRQSSEEHRLGVSASMMLRKTLERDREMEIITS